LFLDRRAFLISTGAAGVSALLPSIAWAQDPAEASGETFSWSGGRLHFRFSVISGSLRQNILLPAEPPATDPSVLMRSGLEVALLCSGEDSPDSGMKQSGGMPGQRLKFAGRREEPTGAGRTLIVEHTDADLHLNVRSYYEAFDGLDVVRRHVEVSNAGQELSVSNISLRRCFTAWPMAFTMGRS
jgi:alpha-galactosidase